MSSKSGTPHRKGDIGLRIQKARESRGLSQAELARNTGLTRQAISQMEKGATKSPKPEHMFKIADALQYNARYLATGEGQITANVMFMGKIIPDKYKKAFCQRTAVIRESAGFTQHEMAIKLNIATNTYAKYESRSLLPHHLIMKFCDLTQVKPEFLIGRPQNTSR